VSGALVWLQESNPIVARIYAPLSFLLGLGFILVGLVYPPRAVVGLFAHFVETLD
jgi:hypothetical protein